MIIAFWNTSWRTCLKVVPEAVTLKKFARGGLLGVFLFLL